MNCSAYCWCCIIEKKEFWLEICFSRYNEHNNNNNNNFLPVLIWTIFVAPICCGICIVSDCCWVFGVFDRTASEGIFVDDEIVTKAGGFVAVFVACNNFDWFTCCSIFVAGFIVVDDINLGPSDLIVFIVSTK